MTEWEPDPSKESGELGGQKTPVREYAQALGVVLILFGLVGLVFGDRLLLAGVLNVFYVPNGIAHLLAGGLLAYLGFGRAADESIARAAVVALGVVYLLVGVLGFVLPILLGLPFRGYSVVDDAFHLLVGVLSLSVGFISGRGTSSRA